VPSPWQRDTFHILNSQFVSNIAGVPPAPPSSVGGGLAAPVYAWGAGVAFLASLGFLAYTYAVPFGEAVAAGSAATRAGAAAFDSVLFGAFALHHSVFARPRAKRWLTRRVAPALERATYVWVASVLLVFVCAAWHPVGGSLYRNGGAAAWVHWAIVALGVVVTAAGARRLRPLELAGIEQARRRPPERAEQLVLAWPYSLVRHPIYLGWVLVVFGVPHMTADRFLLAALSAAYLVVAVPLEERQLERIFGEAYRRYRNQVRWRIVPGVY